MFLSIIIPCYKVEHFLPKTILSLKSLEDASDCEFVFVNDGSPDNIHEIISKFKQEDNRVVYINQTNQGVSAARNAALDVVKGKYIYLLDGDDYLEKNAVKIIKENIDGVDMLIPSLNYVYVKERKRVSNPIVTKTVEHTPDELFRALLVFPTTPMIVYRRELISNNQLRFNNDIKCGEVYDFTISVMEYANRIKLLPDCIYNYVWHEEGATKKVNCAADVTVLNLLQHFSAISQSWTKSTTFLLTAFKMVTSFTINKYIRHNLCDHDVLCAVDMVLENKLFRTLLCDLKNRPIPLQSKILVIYLLYIPREVSYKIAIRIWNLFKKQTN